MGPGYPSNPYFRQDSGSGILGGQGTRQLRLEVVGDGPFPFNAAVGWLSYGELHLATFGEEGARMDLTYLPDSEPIDLTGGGANSMLVISFSSLDTGFGEFLRLVTTVTDTEGTETVHVMDLTGSATAMAAELLFRDFIFADPVGHPLGDPRDILQDAASIRFSFNAYDIPNANIDFGIVSILAVPEPSAILLCGAGLLTAMFLGPRRRSRRMPRRAPS
ncbi:MAG: hypothetical protein U1E05_17280 [Patescibacteria group bacterium]|nr:hypothetical protein [Patescibacteria group bacterium]